jgi:two-component system sensor histidine kinase DesK
MREQGFFGARAWPVWNPARSAGGRWGKARGLVVLALFLAWPFWAAVNAAIRTHTGPARVTALAVVMVAYGASWILAMAHGVRLAPKERVALLGWLFALGFVFAVLTRNAGDLGHLVYSLAAAVWLLPARWSLLTGLAVAALDLIARWTAAGTVGWNFALPIVSQTATPVAVVLLIRLVIQLSQAREEIEMLATAAERARLARDLHDVLGHSLTTITVKTGLARRLLESGNDQELVVTELRDIERLSRQAHAEIRTTVSGHHRPSLAVELVGARAALRAAGITATLPATVDHVLTDLREPFAYVLREGVTNVIRHSDATRCDVQLGQSSLEVCDNGRAFARPGGSGSGLAGLKERLRTVNGQIEAGPLPQGGFRLRASRA